MKKKRVVPWQFVKDCQQVFRLMKIVFVLLVVFGLSVSAKTVGQRKTINLSVKDVSLLEIFERIEKSTDYGFLINLKEIDTSKKYSLNVNKGDIAEVLSVLLDEREYKFSIIENNVIVTKIKQFVRSEDQVLQTQTEVRGVVTDKNGEPLPGVNVYQKSSPQNGVITGIDGAYSIMVDDANEVLVYSYIGFETQEIQIAGRNNIRITLVEETTGLDEVVVVGYGTQRKTELTSSVAKVEAKDFVKGAVSDAGQLIKGKVAGLTIVNPSGDPNATSQIVLRGVTTLRSDSQPLVVIDGVPGSLRDVAANDIESINVLKDGSAAAIYGTRGTNGVILITTKGIHKKTPATVEVDAFISTQRISKEIEMMNAAQMRELVAQNKPGAFDFGHDTKWVDEVLRQPVSQTYNVSLKGGDFKTSYIFNANYQDLEGLIDKSYNEQLTMRAQINHSMYDGKLKFVGVLNGYERSYFNPGGSSAYRMALIYNPTDTPKDEDGNWVEHIDRNNYSNPLALIHEVDGMNKVTNYRVNGTVSYVPIEGMTLKALVSRNIYNRITGYSRTGNHIESIKSNRNGYASRSTDHAVSDLLEITANYTKNLDDHNITVLGGYGYQHEESEGFDASNYDFPSDLVKYHNLSDGKALGEGKAGMDSGKSMSGLVSYFGRVNYSFQNKYMFMASVRYEGSTRFGEDNKWGAFPAFSAGWNIKNEGFMESFSTLSQLKLRAGFGITGTIPSDKYVSLARMKYGSNFYSNGEWMSVIEPSSNANPDLRWEKKEELNIGLEFGFFDNRLSGEIDYYKRTTKDLLWNYGVPSPPYLFGNVLANAGSVENKGIELVLEGDVISKSDFNWHAQVSYSTNQNKLISMSNDKFQMETGYFYTGSTGEPIQSNTHIVREGYKIGDFYGYKSIDIDDDGYWIIEGEDGNPKSIKEQSTNDKKIIGNGLPSFYLSFNNTVSYKNFDLSVNMRGAFGYDILNMTKMFYGVPVSLTRGNVMTSTYDNVYGKRPLADDQELQYVSYYLEDGDFWKIDNISLGYNFKLKSKTIRDLRIYASGQNMFTFTKYSGIDPEVNALGLSPGSDGRDKYPSTRTYTLGLSFKF